MPIRALDYDKIRHQSQNIYEIVAALSRRAKEINEQQRAELEEKLAPFKAKIRNPANEGEADKVFPEQIAISQKYERLPKPTILAIEEYEQQKFTFDYREPNAKGRK